MQDSFTCLAEPDETLAAFGEVPKMRKRACCEAECEECGLEAAGWNNCKAEFGLLRQHDEEFSYRKYRNMPRGLDDKGKRKFQSELVIVKGSRLEFMELLRNAIEAYIRHHFWDIWGLQQRRLAQDKLLQFQLLIHTDFSSVMKFDNKFTSTCDHPQSGTVLVATSQHSPEMKEIEVNVEDEEEETSTVGDATEARVTYGKRKKKKVTKKVLQTDIFRAYSNRKGDYTYHHTVMQDIHHLYKHGYLKHSSEGYIDGVRIPTSAETAWTPEMRLLSKLLVFTDGAPGQYACRQCAHGSALFWKETGSDLEHLICETGCFKGCWDGYGKDCQHSIRRAVANETHVVNNVYDWFKTNATELLVKPTKAETAWENFAANRYIHLYYAFHTIDDKGVVGTDDDFWKANLDCDTLDHITQFKFFCGKRTTEQVGIAEGYAIDKRRNACFCTTDTQECKHTDAIGPIKPDRCTAKDTPTQRKLKSQTMTEFAKSINKADMLLAVAGEREDVDDSSNDGENDCRFWICQTVAPARKLTKQFAEDSMLILVGKWVVDVRWFKVFSHGEGGVQYKTEAGGVCTIPLDSCLKVNDLEWHKSSHGGKVGVLSHDAYNMLDEQWKIEVMR